MKTGKFQILLILTAICSLWFTSCNKDNMSVADKAEQDIDKSMDELQANNYNTSNLKSAQNSGSITIEVDHPDSTTFPKVITIVYNNYQDSTANESFVKNGTIIINVSTNAADYQKVSRDYTFSGFTISTDSTVLSINGSRLVTRISNKARFNGLSSLVLTIKDQVSANNLKFAIVKTGQTDSLKFTRIVSKIRTSTLYFENVGGLNWSTFNFRNILAKDTISYTGTVGGVNEKGDTYTKAIDETKPLIVTFYKGTPVVSSGTMNLSITGTLAASFTIEFKEALPDHPHMTLVTVTNNATQRTHSFIRRFGRKLARWW